MSFNKTFTSINTNIHLQLDHFFEKSNSAFYCYNNDILTSFSADIPQSSFIGALTYFSLYH